MQARKRNLAPFVLAVTLVTALGVAVEAMAAPVVTGALLNTRVFNDSPTSTLTTLNNYPVQVQISDTPQLPDLGFANLHNFHLAVDPITEAVFGNSDNFDFSMDMTISGPGEGESALQVSPWWSPGADGRFQARTTDGEIAAFGGRLPFYSFTGSQGLTYTKGDTINMGVKYRANGLSAASPATIEYLLTLGGTDYTSGVLNFDMGNPAEDPPHGLWGILDNVRVGGLTAIFNTTSGAGNNLTTTWENINYVPEPASLALLALGACAMIRRRR